MYQNAIYETVADHFHGYFGGNYDGSYHTPQADAARRDFDRLTDNCLMWTQVHGDFKDAAKRAAERQKAPPGGPSNPGDDEP